MRAGQKLLTDDNVEVCLFPLEYMNISQDEYGSYSHQGILAIDFLGWGANGRINRCPYYAPCDMTCVYQSTSGAYNIWNSNNKVYLPDGSTDYICLMCIHDNTLPPLGSVVSQGDLLGHTGTAGHVTGDHVHLNMAKGHYEGQIKNSYGKWQLKNSIHLYDGMFVNDTVIINGRGHNWQTYEGGYVPPTPPTPPFPPKYRRGRFPWVLYARKLRKSR